MKKILILFFILLGVGNTFATQVDVQIDKQQGVEADCVISLNFTNIKFDTQTDIMIELNGEAIYIVQDGVLQGPAIVSRTVAQGSIARLEFQIMRQGNLDNGFYLFINNVRHARLHEFSNNNYRYTIDTNFTISPVNFYMLYEP